MAMSISSRFKKNKLPAGYWKNPVYFIACGFGTGASPYAPGTVGTLVGVMLFIPLSQLSLSWYLLVTLLALLAGIWICGITSAAFGKHDHGGIVWDEVVGYLITMTAMPADWLWIVIGFFVFRFFDVIKPWPIRQVDRHVGGGFGVMFDDVLAGIYSWIVMWWLLYSFSQ